MAPERIELTSGLGVEGLAPVATAQAVQGENAATSGDGKEREHLDRRPIRLATKAPDDEAPGEILGLSGDSLADQVPEHERERRQYPPEPDQNQDGGLASHRIDSLA